MEHWLYALIVGTMALLALICWHCMLACKRLVKDAEAETVAAARMVTAAREYRDQAWQHRVLAGSAADYAEYVSRCTCRQTGRKWAGEPNAAGNRPA